MGRWFESSRAHSFLLHKPIVPAHLVDEDISVDFTQVTLPGDRVAVIAAQPLTDSETWIRFLPNQLIVFKEGLPLNLN